MAVVALRPKQQQVLDWPRELESAGADPRQFVNVIARRLGVSRASAYLRVERLRMKGLWGRQAPAPPPPDHLARLLRDLASFIREEEVCTARRRDERRRLLERAERTLGDA